MNKTAAFLSLGCKVNSYETEAIRGMFEAADYNIVDFKDVADVYIVNTCTVTNIADRKSRQMLHQAKKRNPDAIITAVGCYVQADEEKLSNDSSVDLIVGNNRKSEILQLVESLRMKRKNNTDALANINDSRVVDIGAEKDYENLEVMSTMDKVRAFIKIQDGCNRFCSYCIIPYVRGRVRSRDDKDILKEITKLAMNGYKEFVLTGIHLSSYGIERLDNTDQLYELMPLASLIKSISAIPGVSRIRLGSLEPRIITEDFVKEIAGVEQFCPHFHLSLQSGSDTVLSRMNRKYTAEEYESRVQLIRKYFDKPAFTTDVIVGFPGESQEKFNETLDFVSRIGFSHIHVFKYSKRAGTKAATMPNQISNDIMQERSNILINLAEEMSSGYKKLFLGRIEKILIEEEVVINGIKYLIGHNERYLKLAIPAEDNLINQILSVQVEKALTNDILLCKK